MSHLDPSASLDENAYLLRLPEEIQIQIAQCVMEEEFFGKEYLGNLRCTCKQLARICAPVLFKTLDINTVRWAIESNPIAKKLGPYPTQNLGTYVRTLKLYPLHPGWPDEEEDDDSGEEDPQEDELAQEVDDDQEQETQSGEDDQKEFPSFWWAFDQFHTLVNQLPSVRHLVISYYYLYGPHSHQKLIDAITGLEMLQSLEYRDMDWREDDWEDIDQFWLDYCSPLEVLSSVLEGPQGAKITTLVFRGSFNERSLSAVMQSARSLKTLEIYNGITQGLKYTFENGEWACANTLERLKLSRCNGVDPVKLKERMFGGLFGSQLKTVIVEESGSMNTEIN